MTFSMLDSYEFLFDKYLLSYICIENTMIYVKPL